MRCKIHLKIQDMQNIEFTIMVDDVFLIDEDTNILLFELEAIHKKIRLINLEIDVIHASLITENMKETQNVSNPSSVQARSCGKRFKLSKDFIVIIGSLHNHMRSQIVQNCLKCSIFILFFWSVYIHFILL